MKALNPKTKREKPKSKQVSILLVVGANVYRYSPINECFLTMESIESFDLKRLDLHLLAALKECKENKLIANCLFVTVVDGVIYTVNEIFNNSRFKIPKSRKFRRGLCL